MRRSSSAAWLLGVLLTLASCNGIADIYQGAADASPRCASVADCKIEAPACVEDAACVEGHCRFTYALEGAPLAGQVAGDCADIICDGAGRARRVFNAADIPDDDNVCTKDSCSEGASLHKPLTGLIPCYDGPPETEGRGSCAGGIQSCDEGVQQGECAGQVLPAREACDGLGLDDDCDGLVDEDGPGCRCGDGFVSVTYEACDDGNADWLDGCTATCKIPLCGDGVVDFDESCDDATGGVCPLSCELTVLRLAGGFGFTCALFAGRQVSCWGSNDHGELGLGDNESRGDDDAGPFPAIKLGPLERGIALAAGVYHACSLFQDGSVKCWGHNNLGQLGVIGAQIYGDSPDETVEALSPLNLGQNQKAIDVEAGSDYSCAILQDQKVKCWGNNGAGQLGLGDTKTRGNIPGQMGDALPLLDFGAEALVLSLSASYEHTCALLLGGSIKCWGANPSGVLGLGDIKTRGDEPGEMGDNLPAVDLGAGERAVGVALGDLHSCALLESGSVKCWGGNTFGQLGLGDTATRGDEPGEMGDNLPAVDLGAGAKAIALRAGSAHTCALLQGGSIKCWGRNVYGQLGLGDAATRGDEPQEMGGKLAPIDLGAAKKAVALAAGHGHTCALLHDGSVKCWGINDAGQLGLGDAEGRGDQPNEMGDQLPAVLLP